jgi:ABC-type antimicrobial peptide transport system permease subunit
MYYVPLRSFRPVARMVARASGDLSALAAAVGGVGRAIDPDVRLSNVVPFREIVDRTLVVERLVAQVSGAFGVLALLIAAVGLYSVMAQTVVRRRREIGVRVAVGAQPGTIEWMFLRESLRLVVLGMALGIPAAVAVTRLSASMLFGLGPHDPASVGVAVVVLTATVTIAAWVPARRAAGVDPVVVLREE